MTAYSPTTWVNNTPPALNAANLNKLTNELKLQAADLGISHTLITWYDGPTPPPNSPSLTGGGMLNEMERVLQATSAAVGLTYTPTAWQPGWIPARDATNLNKLEIQARNTRTVIDGLPTPDVTPPSAPTNLSASASSSTQINLTWTASTDNVGVTGYRVERNSVQIGTTVNTNFSDTGLTPSTLYSYRVRAQDAGGNLSSYSNTASATTQAGGGQPTPTYYYNWDFAYIADPPWTSIQTDYGTGAYGPGAPPGVQISTDGHSVSLVTAPDGASRALRFELRDADGAWPISSDSMRSQIQMSPLRTWNENSFTVGEIRWFMFEFWLPNNNPTGEYFDWGRNDWNTWIGLHPNAGGVPGWGCFDMGTDGPYSHPFYMTWKLAGGGGTNPNDTLVYPRLFQLTNADGSRYAPNYNRRLQLLIGGKFDPTHAGGWFEAWVDGVNVVPRMSHATMWTGDTSTYFKCGPYKSSAVTFPTNGKSVLYFTRLAIGNP